MEKTAALHNELFAAARTQGRPSAGEKPQDSIFAAYVSDRDNKADVKPEKKDRPERAAKASRHEDADRPEARKAEKPERAEKPAKTEKVQKAEKTDRTTDAADERPVENEDSVTTDAVNDKAEASETADAGLQTADAPDTQQTDMQAIQSAAITIEDLLADIAAAIPVTVVTEQPQTVAAASAAAENDIAAPQAVKAAQPASQDVLPEMAMADGANAVEGIAIPTDDEGIALPQGEDAETFQNFLNDKIAELKAKPATSEQAAKTEAAAAVKQDSVAAAPQIEDTIAKPVQAEQHKAATEAKTAKAEMADVQALNVDAQAKAEAKPIHIAVEKADVKLQNSAAAGANASAALPTAAGVEAGKAQLPYEHRLTVARTQNVSQPALVEQVSVRLNQAAKNGEKGFNIQLHPAELGRIEVKLDVGQNGEARATVTADNSATLELMQKDRGSLERALTDAGLKLDSGSLNFNLREGNQQQSAFQQSSQQSHGRAGQAREIEEMPTQVITLAVGIDLASGRVDIRA